MYSWISPRSYEHGQRVKVFFRDLQGKRCSTTFATEAEASTWIADAQRLLVQDGRPMDAVVNAFVASQTRRAESTRRTLGFRLASFIDGRQRISVETFPWTTAWRERVEPQSGASQVGILSALRQLVAFAGLPAKVLDACKVTKSPKHGKDQLRIDEGRKFVVAGLEAGDPLALAAATMAFTGCRPSEVLNLRARDVDDGGAVLWVEGSKTERAKRQVQVDPDFQPVLLGAASGKEPGDLLFPHVPQRHRKAKDPAKARRDALQRRVRDLCKAAGVPLVVPHSLRGLNSTLRKLGGAPDDSITRALGHVDISTTRRSYFAPGIAEQTDARRAFGRLLPKVA